MDEAVSARLQSLALAVVMLVCTAATAQALQDPTRPPDALLPGKVAGVAGVAVPAASAAPRLQSILIARHSGGRHVAIIDGQTLQPGDLYKGARLEHMTDTEVVLVKDKQRTVLKLYPATNAQAVPAVQR